MNRAIRVGIIGAGPETAWANQAHVPAISSRAGFDLRAVAGHGMEGVPVGSAVKSGPRVFQSGHDLIADPDIELVTIAISVPEHRALVLAALQSGKHVYCEWPLARDLAEAKELAAAARAAKVKTAVGLQGRSSPAVRKARDLIAEGAIGRLLNARVIATSSSFGAKVADDFAYSEIETNGVTLPNVQGGHTLDLIIAVLGGIVEGSAMASTVFGEVEIGRSDRRVLRSTNDHLLVFARLADEAPISVEIAGGREAHGETLRLEAVGSHGILTLLGDGLPGFQAGRLRLALNGRELGVDEGSLANLADAAVNVAATYALLREDILRGTSRAANFEHAVRLTSLNHDLLDSSRGGVRKRSADWPKH